MTCDIYTRDIYMRNWYPPTNTLPILKPIQIIFVRSQREIQQFLYTTQYMYQNSTLYISLFSRNFVTVGSEIQCISVYISSDFPEKSYICTVAAQKMSEKSYICTLVAQKTYVFG